MLKPIFFIPCEKCCWDHFSGEVHLIGVLDIAYPVPNDEYEMRTKELQGQEHSVKLVYSGFSVATEWAKSVDDPKEIEFEQNIWLTAPDGREVEMGKPLTIKMEKRRHRAFQDTSLIAARMSGEYLLVLKRRITGEEEWTACAEFPILLMEPREQNTADS